MVLALVLGLALALVLALALILVLVLPCLAQKAANLPKSFSMWQNF